MSKIMDYNTLCANVAAMRTGNKSASTKKNANGEDLVNQQDDATHNRHTVEVPKDPEASDAKQHMPASGDNAEATNPSALKVTSPGDFTHDVPSTVKKPAIDPNADFNTDKLANDAQSVLKRVRELLPGKTASTPVASASSSQSPVVSAASVDGSIQFDPQFHFKLASIILESNEGIQLAERLIAERRGQEEAYSIIKQACDAHQTYLQAETEAAQFHQSQEFQRAAEEQAIKEAFAKLSPDEQKKILKVAHAHAAALENFPHPWEKIAFAQGAADGQQMMDQAGGDPNAVPEDASLPGADPSQGGGPGGAPGGGASVEELVQILQLLVQSGEIDEQTAMKVIADLQSEGGGQGGPGGPEGAAPGPGGGGAPGAQGEKGESEGGDSPEEQEGKAAAKKAAAMLATLA